MTPETSPGDHVSRVEYLLVTIGDALVDGAVDPLLDTEQELGQAVQVLAALAAQPTAVPPEDRAHLQTALVRCRAALERCRRLGASFEQLAVVTLEADSRSGTYTRTGLTSSSSPAAGLKVRG